MRVSQRGSHHKWQLLPLLPSPPALQDQEMAQADEDWSDLESLPEALTELPGEERK